MYAVNKMRPIATDVARVSVCVSMYCAKTAEPIEMPFEGILLGPRNHVLDQVEIPRGKGQFWGLSCPLKSIGSLLSCDVRNKRDNLLLKAMWPLSKIV